MKVKFTLTVIAEVEIDPKDYMDMESEEEKMPTIQDIQALEQQRYEDDPHGVFDSLVNTEGMKDEFKVELAV